MPPSGGIFLAYSPDSCYIVTKEKEVCPIMETLFENRYTRSDAIIKEYMRRTQLLGSVSIALYLMVLYFTVRAFVLWYGTGALDIKSLLASAAVLIMYFALYLAKERSALKQNRRKKLKMHFTATETHLTVKSGDFTSQISYHDIRSVKQTRNLIVVFTRSKVGWIFPRSTFTKGTAEEFLYYLQAKGQKVRI